MLVAKVPLRVSALLLCYYEYEPYYEQEQGVIYSGVELRKEHSLRTCDISQAQIFVSSLKYLSFHKPHDTMVP